MKHCAFTMEKLWRHTEMEYGETLVQNVVHTRLLNAEELLESGIHNRNPRWILEAKAIFCQLLQLVPELKSKILRALTALSMIDEKNALLYLEEGFNYDSQDPTILNNLAYILHKKHGNFDAATKFYQDCLSLDPTFEVAYLGLSDVYRSLRLFKLEREFLKRGVQSCPKSGAIWNALGMNYLSTASYRKLDMPLNFFQRALELASSDETKAMIKVNLGHLSGLKGETTLALSHYADAIRLSPNVASAYQNGLLNLHYFERATTEVKQFLDAVEVTPLGETYSTTVVKAHIAVSSRLYGSAASSVLPPPPPKKTAANWMLRVGYMSSDFFEHAVSRFFQAILDEGNFEPYLYSNIIYDATMVGKVKCKGYRCVKDLSAPEVAKLIRADEIDILVDLSGFTQGNRADVLALRPEIGRASCRERV